MPLSEKGKLRIGYFLYGKGLGGNGRYVESLLERLDTRRHEVTVYLYCPEGEDREKFVQHAQSLGVRICPFTAEGFPAALQNQPAKNPALQEQPKAAAPAAAVRPSLKESFRLWVYYLKAVWTLRNFFRSENLDVLHLSLGTFPTLLHVINGAMLAGIRSLTMIVHILEAPRAQRSVDRFLMSRVVSGTIPVIALSNTMKKELLSRFGFQPERVHVVYNGVDPDAYGYGHVPILNKQTLGLKSAERAVLVPARFHQVKGHDILFKAIAQNRESLRNHVFLLAGEGPLEEPLKRQAAELGISERVRFIGFRNDIPSLLTACDFTVLPSWNEGFPFVLLESMATGKPVIGTDVGAVCEMIYEGKNGFMVKAGDVDALGRAILELANASEEQRLEMGAWGAGLIRDRFSLDLMLESTFAHYGAPLSELIRKPEVSYEGVKR